MKQAVWTCRADGISGPVQRVILNSAAVSSARLPLSLHRCTLRAHPSQSACCGRPKRLSHRHDTVVRHVTPHCGPTRGSLVCLSLCGHTASTSARAALARFAMLPLMKCLLLLAAVGVALAQGWYQLGAPQRVIVRKCTCTRLVTVCVCSLHAGRGVLLVAVSVPARVRSAHVGADYGVPPHASLAPHQHAAARWPRECARGCTAFIHCCSGTDTAWRFLPSALCAVCSGCAGVGVRWLVVQQLRRLSARGQLRVL